MSAGSGTRHWGRPRPRSATETCASRDTAVTCWRSTPTSAAMRRVDLPCPYKATTRRPVRSPGGSVAAMSTPPDHHVCTWATRTMVDTPTATVPLTRTRRHQPGKHSPRHSPRAPPAAPTLCEHTTPTDMRAPHATKPVGVISPHLRAVQADSIASAPNHTDITPSGQQAAGPGPSPAQSLPPNGLHSLRSSESGAPAGARRYRRPTPWDTAERPICASSGANGTPSPTGADQTDPATRGVEPRCPRISGHNPTPWVSSTAGCGTIF